jgi:hypothetical protein
MKLPRLRWSIRTLIVLTVLVGIGCWTWVRLREPYVRQQAAVAELEKAVPQGVTIFRRVGPDFGFLLAVDTSQVFMIDFDSQAEAVPWSTLEDFWALKSAHFSSVPTSDEFAKFCRSAPGVEEIVFRSGKFSPEYIQHLSTLPKLKKLSLSWSSHLDPNASAWLSRLDLLTTVEFLHLWGTMLSDEQLVAIPTMPRLQGLSIQSSNFRGEGLRHLSTSQPQLTFLSLQRIEFSQELAEVLGQMPQLRELCLVGGKVDRKVLGVFATQLQLEYVEFAETSGVTDEGLGLLAKSTTLKSIRIRGAWATEHGIRKLLAIPTLLEISWPLPLPTDVETELRRRREASDID